MSNIANRLLRPSSIKNIISIERALRCSSTLQTSYDNNQSSDNSNKYIHYMGATGLAAAGISTYLLLRDKKKVLAEELNTNYGKFSPDLPTYKMSEISKHTDCEKRVWVTYKEGVYDITKFIEEHPGGDMIMMSAGGSVEPFWQLYAVHKRPEILDILESYRIGNLDKDDIDTSSPDDPYGKEPRRHPALIPASKTPFNAEPPGYLLVESFLTPQDLFYVRNHLPVPEVDEKTHKVEISGEGIKTKTFKMADIKKLPKVTITAAIQCAGNRRSEMVRVKPVRGLDWKHAAIGNATWSGARLSDILNKMGVDIKKTNANHVQFEGLDVDPSNAPYGASIPIAKALDPKGDVILAYEMNGEPLSRDHGGPVRVIVPGITGARNVKWLSRVVVSQEESKSHWQQNDYKGFSPSIDWDSVDFSKSPAIQELPVTSAICSPSDGETVKLHDNTIPVKGYAWSGGGRKIIRVDVSCDQGKTWHAANLDYQDGNKHPYHWGWTLWSIQLPLPSKTKKCEIWVKAVDSSYNTQPEDFKNIWNLRGVLSNAYHRITVKI